MSSTSLSFRLVIKKQVYSHAGGGEGEGGRGEGGRGESLKEVFKTHFEF